jgi:chromate transporter
MIMASQRAEEPAAAAGEAVSFAEAFGVWSRVALLSFGGPAGQIAVMHRIVVDEKKWVSEPRFLHALNYCMLLPGPEAQQLATYIGWLMHGTRGGLLAGGLFILPGIVAIMALSWVYVLFSQLPAVTGLLFGLKAAVLAIVVQAVVRIGSRALRSRTMVAIAAAAFIALFFFRVPFPLVIAGAAAIGMLASRGGSIAPSHAGAADEPALAAANGGVRSDMRHSLIVAGMCLVLWLVPVALLLVTLGPSNVFSTIAVFFSKMAVVTFGGAYAALAYVAQQAVEHYGWLKPHEMLDGLGMAETTPGPLIMVLQFVGFLAAYRSPGMLAPLLAGTLGGLLATWVTFAPCFLWIFLGAPFIELLRGNRLLAGALAAITAAVVGVIVNLALWFAIHTIFSAVNGIALGPLRFDLPVLSSVDPAALVLVLAALAATFIFRVGMLPVLAGTSLAGLLWTLFASA